MPLFLINSANHDKVERQPANCEILKKGVETLLYNLFHHSRGGDIKGGLSLHIFLSIYFVNAIQTLIGQVKFHNSDWEFSKGPIAAYRRSYRDLQKSTVETSAGWSIYDSVMYRLVPQYVYTTLLNNLNAFCISESFNKNISHQTFDYTKTFVN